MARSPVAPLPEHSRVARYVGYSKLRRDGEGVAIGVLPAAFALRPGEAYLSAAHVDAFSGSSLERLSALRAAYDPHPLVIKRGGAFTVGVVGEIRAACASHERPVRIVTAPKSKLDCYVEVRQFRDDSLDLLNALADEAWAEVTLVAAIP
jgi:hypothetical protein